MDADDIRAGLDHVDRQCLEHIAKHGWSATGVFDADGDIPPFTYSIGFLETWDAPEVLISGLAPDQAHGVLAGIAAGLKEGKSIEPGLCQWALGGGMVGEFVELHPSTASAHLKMAERLGTRPLRAMQFLWPDEHNRLPGTEGCAAYCTELQMLTVD